MLQDHKTRSAAVVLAILAGTALAGPNDEPKSGVVIDVNAKRTLYPIAVPTSPDGDQGAAKEIASVASFDLNVAGVFKVLEPQSSSPTSRPKASGSIRRSGRTPARSA